MQNRKIKERRVNGLDICVNDESYGRPQPPEGSN